MNKNIKNHVLKESLKKPLQKLKQALLALKLKKVQNKI